MAGLRVYPVILGVSVSIPSTCGGDYRLHNVYLSTVSTGIAHLGLWVHRHGLGYRGARRRRNDFLDDRGLVDDDGLWNSDRLHNRRAGELRHGRRGSAARADDDCKQAHCACGERGFELEHAVL